MSFRPFWQETSGTDGSVGWKQLAARRLVRDASFSIALLGPTASNYNRTLGSVWHEQTGAGGDHDAGNAPFQGFTPDQPGAAEEQRSGIYRRQGTNRHGFTASTTAGTSAGSPDNG